MAAAAATLDLPDLAAIRQAAARIGPHVHRTPVMTCAAIDVEVGAKLFFKCEHLQRVGAFKARGACNAVFRSTRNPPGAVSSRTPPAITAPRWRMRRSAAGSRRGS